MSFPRNFHGQTQWVGYPLQRGISLDFVVTYMGGLSDFRMVHVVLNAKGQTISLVGSAPTLNVRDLDGYHPDNAWGRDNPQRQAKVITGKFKWLRLTQTGNGFKLEAYFTHREPADLVWLYEPKEGQPVSSELLGGKLCVHPTPIAEIEEYQIPIYRPGFEPEAQAMA